MHAHAGAIVFQQESSCGNGTVSVTAHAASCPLPQADSRRILEWRTMRFNEVTRQSVAKVWLSQHPDGTARIEMQPNCLAMEYLKTMASAGKSLSLHNLTSLHCQRQSQYRCDVHNRNMRNCRGSEPQSSRGTCRIQSVQCRGECIAIITQWSDVTSTRP